MLKMPLIHEALMGRRPDARALHSHDMFFSLVLTPEGGPRC